MLVNCVETETERTREREREKDMERERESERERARAREKGRERQREARPLGVEARLYLREPHKVVKWICIHKFITVSRVCVY